MRACWETDRVQLGPCQKGWDQVHGSTVKAASAMRSLGAEPVAASTPTLAPSASASPMRRSTPACILEVMQGCLCRRHDTALALMRWTTACGLRRAWPEGQLRIDRPCCAVPPALQRVCAARRPASGCLECSEASRSARSPPAQFRLAENGR